MLSWIPLLQPNKEVRHYVYISAEHVDYMWIMGKVDEERLNRYTPKFIQEAERNEILVTPQNV